MAIEPRQPAVAPYGTWSSPITAELVARSGVSLGMLGEAFLPLLTRDGAARRGFGITPADEALAMVVVEASGKALVVSNADLTSTRAGGLRTDLAAAFLRGFSDSAGLTIHVRLIEGENSQHVLEAIFKGLGVALARACDDA